MSYDLTATEQSALAKCLHALDHGEELEQCLARYPQQANALRPYLLLRSEIESIEHPEPQFAGYEAGRDTLLRRVTQEHARPLVERAGIRSRLNLTRLGSLFTATFGRLESTVGRMAAVAIALFVFGGGALGAAAASGFEPAQYVLSKPLSVIEPLAEPIIGPITGGGSSPPPDAGQESGNAGLPPSSEPGTQPAGPPRATPAQPAGPPRATPAQPADPPRATPAQPADPPRATPAQPADPPRATPAPDAGPPSNFEPI